MTPTSREEARALGLKRYFTGRPCSRDHMAPRSVHRGECLECIAHRKRERFSDPEQREKLRQRNRDRHRRRYQDPELRRRILECNAASKRRRRGSL